MARKPARKMPRKMPRKPPHRAPRARKEPTDIEKANAAGVQYAEDQLEGDYFTDWVRDQLLEASRMPEDKVLPLETKSDAMVIAKKMLRQLERDTKRDLSPHDIESSIGVETHTREDTVEPSRWVQRELGARSRLARRRASRDQQQP